MGDSVVSSGRAGSLDCWFPDTRGWIMPTAATGDHAPATAGTTASITRHRGLRPAGSTIPASETRRKGAIRRPFSLHPTRNDPAGRHPEPSENILRSPGWMLFEPFQTGIPLES